MAAHDDTDPLAPDDAPRADAAPPPPSPNVEVPPTESADPAAALDQVVDDTEERAAALAWASQHLIAGRPPDALIDDLLREGWPAESAQDVVETARKATRAQRGVITREAVARAANANYRRATSLRWFSALPNFASLWRLLSSLVSLRTLRRMGSRHDRN